MEGTFVVLGCGPTAKGAWWRKDGALISSYDGQVWLFEVGVPDEGEYTCSADSQIFNYLLIIQGTCRTGHVISLTDRVVDHVISLVDHVISLVDHVISLADHVIFYISEI